MGRLPCAMLGQSTEHFFFYNAVSVKTVIFGPFFVLKKLRAGDFVMRKCDEEVSRVSEECQVRE